MWSVAFVVGGCEGRGRHTQPAPEEDLVDHCELAPDSVVVMLLSKSPVLVCCSSNWGESDAVTAVRGFWLAMPQCQARNCQDKNHPRGCGAEPTPADSHLRSTVTFFATLTNTPLSAPGIALHPSPARRTRPAAAVSSPFAPPPVSCMRLGHLHVAKRLIAATGGQPWLKLDANAPKTPTELQMCARN